VKLFTLTNSQGTVVKITNYGGIVTHWFAPDKAGKQANIVLGFDSLAAYMRGTPYFGAIIGRYGNRIAKGKFTLEDQTYTLATNDGPNHLHGGIKGFDKVVWTPAITADSIPQLTLTYTSADGEEGYPGTLQVKVVYTLGDNDDLIIAYTATTDKTTPVNLTNHSYFNLTGDVTQTILAHELEVDANAYTPVDTTLIPTGEMAPVDATPFDFRRSTAIGARIDSVPGGYDHNFVLNRVNKSLQKVATLYDPQSGRALDIITEEPGLQFYSGNFLDGSLTSSDGKPIRYRTGLCLETQHFPNSPNQANFPPTWLKPGETYQTTTIYKAYVKK
jgi:aldose 1-epimerase